ncbi:uncharacterized protein LOC110983517 [Acanthaster planci]|uniref:Uncharacterized protein LOC110983517 n=1 Tax=Acanthaster planci TaxID=133434 RepID=A0A8B7Z164_ACAPL|nr:uncharacterized protein LOC110983517 [Acanthaster planci]
MRPRRTFVMSFLMASILIHAICCDEIKEGLARNDRSLAMRLWTDSDNWKLCFASTTYVCFCSKSAKIQACYNPKEFKLNTATTDHLLAHMSHRRRKMEHQRREPTKLEQGMRHSVKTIHQDYNYCEAVKNSKGLLWALYGPSLKHLFEYPRWNKKRQNSSFARVLTTF